MLSVKSILNKKTKFIFCFLLRSVSCFATYEASKISIRVANFDDINNIKNCNLANLPENYETSFYINHLSRWPDLSIVAENSESELVGYCLGSITESPPLQKPVGSQVYRRVNPSIEGHVTSLAVYNKYRNQKVAFKLMETLHSQMVDNYDVDKVTLHVRQSNTPAVRLYSNTFPYKTEEHILGYYADGEDGLRMILRNLKEFVKSQQEKAFSNLLAGQDFIQC